MAGRVKRNKDREYFYCFNIMCDMQSKSNMFNINGSIHYQY